MELLWEGNVRESKAFLVLETTRRKCDVRVGRAFKPRNYVCVKKLTSWWWPYQEGFPGKGCGGVQEGGDGEALGHM